MNDVGEPLAMSTAFTLGLTCPKIKQLFYIDKPAADFLCASYGAQFVFIVAARYCARAQLPTDSGSFAVATFDGRADFCSVSRFVYTAARFAST